MAVNEEKEESNRKMQQLQELLNSNPNDSSLHFNLGVLLWEKEDDKLRAKAVEHFVAVAKLDPQNGAAFRYLGHYYTNVASEPQRALKCYQRAVALNPDDSDAGDAVCDLLYEGGKESLVLAICREASEKSAKAFWAFRRLGYLLAHQKKWSEAIQSLQNAIRGFPRCACLWETLGLAYERMGMFTAALKSYGKAIEYEDSRVFSLVESGNISLMLGSSRKGIEQFQQALKVSPHNVAAHYGLASALLGLAREFSNMGAFKWGASLLEEASEYSVRGTSLACNMSCMWKLHGDIQLLYARCFPWTEEIKSTQLDETAFKYSVSIWRQTCFIAAKNASRAYQRALHLAPWQANLYADVSIASDLSFSLEYAKGNNQNLWSVAEKMCLGAIHLEGYNEEFWVALGCLSDHRALKQHSLIRALQLDTSLAVAWAYIGKLYRKVGENKFAQQAFDRARSIDPSLSLPWAGMSADADGRKIDRNEAYECCLRAVQTNPLADFQVGLAKLALQSSNLTSSEVFGAVQQALEHVPHYPEIHNMNGLVCESRSDYKSAITSYRLARYVLTSNANESLESCLQDISINLARSLCKAGDASNAVDECEYLRQKGQLNSEGLQIYALCLWKLGKNDMALSIIRTLASHILSMEPNLAAVSISFVCRMLFYVSGPESAITSILKMPKEFLSNSMISFVIYAIHVLDGKDQLQSVVSSSRSFITSREESIAMDVLIGLGKTVKHGRCDFLAVQKGVNHLKKALHMFPNSNVLRDHLSYLLLSSKEWEDLYLATRCSSLDLLPDHEKDNGLGIITKSASEIFGAATVACYTMGTSQTKFLFPTCRHQQHSESGAIRTLQKFLHQEPWNFNARYLLTLNYFQKAREEKFPIHTCKVIERLTNVGLSNQYGENTSYKYQHFQLQLCAAEVILQQGNYGDCLKYARKASKSSVHNSYLFFAHLLLCRAHASEADIPNLSKEFKRCLDLKTDFHIGWICLKFIESGFGLESNSSVIPSFFEECSKDIELSWNMWMSVFNVVQGLIAIGSGDFVGAEEFLLQACTIAKGESCFFICHGAICMELARQTCESQYISRAIKSLKKAKETSLRPLPIISLLLAQAEGSISSKDKWENNLKEEWFSWPPEIRPAELLFQMHLVFSRIKDDSMMASSLDSYSLKWISRAIHVNPSCSRYWKYLQKHLE